MTVRCSVLHKALRISYKNFLLFDNHPVFNYIYIDMCVYINTVVIIIIIIIKKKIHLIQNVLSILNGRFVFISNYF